MAANFLVRGDFIDTITISNYANANNAQFGTSTLLATRQNPFGPRRSSAISDCPALPADTASLVADRPVWL